MSLVYKTIKDACLSCVSKDTNLRIRFVIHISINKNIQHLNVRGEYSMMPLSDILANFIVHVKAAVRIFLARAHNSRKMVDNKDAIYI